jgi:hypothetical protein
MAKMNKKSSTTDITYSLLPYPRWEGHRAQELLETDVRKGKNILYKASFLVYWTKDEYNLFPLHVFKKHYHTEVQRQAKCKDLDIHYIHP